MKIIAVGFCIAVAGCQQAKSTPPAQAPESDHFQMAVDNEGSAWQLNTKTGELKHCWRGSPGINPYPPTCYKAYDKPTDPPN